jgi:hypothetical protein
MNKHSDGNSQKGGPNEYHHTSFDLNGAIADSFYYVNDQDLSITFTPGSADRTFQVVQVGSIKNLYKAKGGVLCTVALKYADVEDINIWS